MHYELIWKKNGEFIHVTPTGKWVIFSLGDRLGVQVCYLQKRIFMNDLKITKYIDSSELDIVYSNGEKQE